MDISSPARAVIPRTAHRDRVETIVIGGVLAALIALTAVPVYITLLRH
jgi:hypothetical protein